ncbi:MAG: hypothetical protein Q9226_008109, partial [Calogaya cf. arnoldii]
DGTGTGVKITASNDAGLYVCELLSYVSLDVLWREKEFARVVFLHVPRGDEEDKVQRGVDVAVGLMEACMEGLLGGMG